MVCMCITVKYGNVSQKGYKLLEVRVRDCMKPLLILNKGKPEVSHTRLHLPNHNTRILHPQPSRQHT